MLRLDQLLRMGIFSFAKLLFILLCIYFQDVEAETVRSKENEGNERDEAFGVLSSLKV